MNLIKIKDRWLTKYEAIRGNDNKTYFINLTFDENIEDRRAIPEEYFVRMILSALRLLRMQGEQNIVCSFDTLETLGKSLQPTNTVAAESNPTVELDIPSLQKFMMREGISNQLLARTMGFEGKRIAYGSKIATGALKPRKSNIELAAQTWDHFKKYL